LRRLPDRRIEETLNTPHFHFNGFSNKAVSQFSGGMLQRLGLAVACLPNSPVLVLDEPTSSLDLEGAIQFREFLASLKRQGKTIVFSSHMIADVEQLADRVAILVGGRLIALQSVAALRGELTRASEMRVTINGCNQRLFEAARAAGAIDVRNDTDCLIIKCAPEDRFEILRALSAAGGKVLQFATKELSIEDIYMQYVKKVNAVGQAQVGKGGLPPLQEKAECRNDINH
jgi:ABC-type multidrug transport system ATPase subunit